MNKDNFSHIEIRTCKELGRTFTEVYLDGKKLRGVRSWNLSHDGTNSIPRLLLDLNAFDIAVDADALAMQKGYEGYGLMLSEMGKEDE